MAEAQIVSCPGCGKRYTVPGGVPPGQFQCQDCSAVVVYGRNADPPGPPRPHGAGSARSHARAAAAKRKLARNRESREDDDDGDDDRRDGRGGGKDSGQKSAMPYVMGFLALGGLVAFFAFLATKGGKDKAAPPPVARGGTGPGMATEETGLRPIEKEPATPVAHEIPRVVAPVNVPPPPAEGGIKTAVRGGIEEKKETYKVAANPPTGGNYDKSQAAILVLLKESRSAVIMDLGHLPDTPADLAKQIDADVVHLADPNAGRDFFRAQDRLSKVGRAAIPRVLGIAAKLDFTKFSKVTDALEACAVGDAIDNVMREITGFDKFTRLQYGPNSKLEDYTQTINEWFLWWYTTGAKRETFYKPDAGGDEKL